MKVEDGSESIENFKMARRCTIPLPFARPALIESYADYFIVGAYEEKPFQVDVFDRSKSCSLTIDTARELRRSLKRRAIPGATITSLSRLVVPRLKWSDRICESYEQKKRTTSSKGKSSLSEPTGGKCNLRRLLLIGNVKLDSVHSSD